MPRLAHAFFAATGFIVALFVLAHVYGPTDSHAAAFGIVCLAVMLGNVFDLILKALFWALLIAVALIAWPAYALGSRLR